MLLLRLSSPPSAAEGSKYICNKIYSTAIATARGRRIARRLWPRYQILQAASVAATRSYCTGKGLLEWDRTRDTFSMGGFQQGRSAQLPEYEWHYASRRAAGQYQHITAQLCRAHSLTTVPPGKISELCRAPEDISAKYKMENW